MTSCTPDDKADSTRETLSVRAFLARIARSSDPTITAWIRVSVVDEIDLPELRWRRFELADPTRGRYGGALWATLLRSTVDKLSSGIGALLPDNDLLGQDVELLVQARRQEGKGLATEILDVDPEWVRRQANANRREFFEMFERVGKLGLQASMRDRPINTIEVLYAPQDPSWPTVKRRLDALAEQGVSYQALARDLAGNAGYIQVTSHFEELQQRDDQPDLLLIVADPVEGDFLRFLDDPITAAVLLMIDLPVVVGARPGRWGSSLHRLAFAAADSPVDAAEIVEDLIRVARAAPVVTQRVATSMARQKAEGQTGKSK